MKWLGSRIGAALDDWQGALLMGLFFGLTGAIFYSDTPRDAFIWGVGAALAWVLMNVIFGPVRRKSHRKQTRR